MDQCQHHENFWTPRHSSQVVNWIKTKPRLAGNQIPFGGTRFGFVLEYIIEGILFLFSWGWHWSTFRNIGCWAYFKKTVSIAGTTKNWWKKNVCPAPWRTGNGHKMYCNNLMSKIGVRSLTKLSINMSLATKFRNRAQKMYKNWSISWKGCSKILQMNKNENLI